MVKKDSRGFHRARVREPFRAHSLDEEPHIKQLYEQLDTETDRLAE